jgi:hypothetical protein
LSISALDVFIASLNAGKKSSSFILVKGGVLNGVLNGFNKTSILITFCVGFLLLFKN